MDTSSGIIPYLYYILTLLYMQKKPWMTYLQDDLVAPAPIKPDCRRRLSGQRSACVLYACHKVHAQIQNTQHYQNLLGISKFRWNDYETFKYYVEKHNKTLPTQFITWMTHIVLLE